MSRHLRVTVTAAAFITLLLVVALASRTHVFGQSPPLPAGLSRVVLDTLLYLALALDLLVLALIVWAFTAERQGELPPLPRRSLLAYVISPLAVAALLGSLVLLRARLARGGLPGQPGPGGLLGLPSPPAGLIRGAAGGPGGFDWIALGLVLVLLGAVAAIAWLQLRSPRRALRARPRAQEQAKRTLDLALQELEREPDPRRAVIAAYARMERVLAWHDLPRRHFEAPLEYLARVLGFLGAGGSDLTRLTDLFQRAKFSRHEITSGDKAAAIESLKAVREHVA
ncbi:MAG TPA: DUF4129 domain-containing protein [Candidatus Acidoferrales bacterium]|nr:DUF4129 domain-containing protein [Candidatus Acidoferrales bacterium]